MSASIDTSRYTTYKDQLAELKGRLEREEGHGSTERLKSQIIATQSKVSYMWNEHQKEKIARLGEQIRELDLEVQGKDASLEEMRAYMEDSLSRARASLEAKEKERAELEAAATAHIEGLETTSRSREAAIESDARTHIEGLQAENYRMTESLAIASAKVERLNSELLATKNERNAYRQAHADSSAEAGTLKAEKRDLLDTIARYEMENKGFEERAGRFQAKAQETQDKFERQINSLRKNLHEQGEKATAHIDSLNANLSSEREEKAQLVRENAALKEALRNLQSAFSTIKVSF